MEQAARCDTLYLPVVSEDRSAVPAVHRRRIGEWAVGDPPNVIVAETGRYLISSASFPDYFSAEVPAKSLRKRSYRCTADWGSLI